MADSQKKKTKTKPPAPTKEEKARMKAEKEEQIALEMERLKKEKKLHDEIIAIIIIAVGIFLLLSLLMQNSMGVVGSFVSKLLFGVFGQVAYILAGFLIVYGILILARKTAFLTGRTVLCLILLFIFITCLNSIRFLPDEFKFRMPLISQYYKAGLQSAGVIGMLLGSLLKKLVSVTGIYIISITGIIITLLFIINTPISSFLDEMKIRHKAAKKAKEEQQERENQYAQQLFWAEKPQGVVFSDPEPEEKKETAKPKKEVKKVEEKPYKPIEQEEPRLDLSSIKEDTPQTEEEPVIYENPDGIYSDNQMKILDYLNDESLFNRGEKSGLGFGLNGGPAGGSKTFGLNGTAAVQAEEEVKQEPPKKKAEPVVSAKEEEVNVPESEPCKAPAPAPEKYKFPPISLLKVGEKTRKSNVDTLQEQARKLEETLASFKVQATVSNVIQGPSVTRFEVQPAPGVKVKSIQSLQNDIALNLRAKSIRIEAPIPGEPAVGIEVSNDTRASVTLRELIESPEFRDHKSKIAVALGKDIAGKNIVANLKDMPHLLIAGATGSGKSVCINGMIMSILYKARPEEVKLILIDPKVVELSNYNGIPHLLIPVVTEPGKASAALGWAVSEMNERYNKFAEEGVRDFEGYNEMVIANCEDDKVLPQIVIIIDELADLIMTAQNSVEDSICRLAQKARAAGMHLIVATQRPSVDVITGVIKANIPSRIALAVSSQVDSRTILDTAGAEKLLGKGDMLYDAQGSPTIRVQGCYVSDAEVNAVIDYVKKNAPEVEYSSDVSQAIASSGAGAPKGEELEDDLLPDAIETVVKAEMCSVSMLQRRFRIGYNRAARLVDMMEERGVVGPADGARPRKVLLNASQLGSIDQITNAYDIETDEDDGVPDEIGPERLEY